MPRRRRRLTEKRKPTKPAANGGEWFSIRGILDERTVSRCKIQYLVDWDDNKVTGESYPPSWVLASDVLEDAIEEWNNSKQPSPAEVEPSQAVSDDSEPPRPAHRQRTKITTRKRPRAEEAEEEEDDDDDEAPSPKRARLETLSPSLEPDQSNASSVCLGSEYEDPPIPHPAQPELVVEIRKDPELDISEYLSVHGSQGTSAQQTSQPVSELESQDQRIAIAPTYSQGTIRDSQDPSSLESQRRETQNSSASNPVVIPDSQDFGPREPSPAKDSSYPDASGSEPQDESGSSSYCEEVVPRSTGVEGEIPSRQPDLYSSLGSQDLSANKASDQGTVPEPDGEAPFEPPNTTEGEAEPEPVYLTQPIVDHDRQVTQTSSSDITQEQREASSSAEARVESQPAHSLGVTEDPSLGTLQAAQVLHRPHEPTQHHFTASHSTNTETPPASTSGCENNELPPHSWCASGSSQKSHQSATDFLERGFRALSRGKDPPQYEMFREEESRPAEQGGSAVDRIRGLWDAAPTSTEEPAPNTEGHSSAADELAALSALESHNDRPLEPERTSLVSFFTQPPLHTGPWGSEATGEQGFGSNSAVGDRPHQSTAESVQALVNQAYSMPGGVPSEGLIPPPDFNLEQGTVSPADVSKPGEAERRTLPLLLPFSEDASSGPFTVSGNSITLGQVPQTHEESPEPSDEESKPMNYIVTLPFQASIRDLYDTTLLEYKSDAMKFGEVFTNEIYEPPEDSLVRRIDELFNRLQNLCDYPEDIVGTAVEHLPTEEKVKYSSGANGKFNFLYELLQGINADTNVLVVVPYSNLLRPLVELVEALELDCTCDALGHTAKGELQGSAVRVTLALPHAADPSGFDVVVGYDSSFNNSAISASLSSGDFATSGKKAPLVVRLIAAFSIEHIDLELSDTLTGLERKSALLVGISKARALINDPPRLPEPYEVAKLFADYLNGETEAPVWAPEPLPDRVLDVYFSQQTASQMPPATTPDAENGRKRKLTEDEDEDGDVDAETKRMRRFSRTVPVPEVTLPPLSTAVRGLLNSAGFRDSKADESRVSVPLSVLETLAAKMAEVERATEANNLDVEYKRLIKDLSTRVKELEATYEDMYEKYRNAVQDRTQFEGQAHKADAAFQAKAEEMRRAEEKSAVKIEELEARVARLTDDAATGSSLGATDKLLQEEKEKTRVLELRLGNSHGEKDYAMEQCRNANSAISAMRAELDQLKKTNEDLAQRASGNLLKIHQIQNDNTIRAHIRKIKDLEIRLREGQIELDHVREELRQLKSGRRETRQVSVPRSPRPGLMSPRPPPRVGGSASRGASPGPVMGGFDGASTGGVPAVQFTNSLAGSGRWNPLS